MFFAVVTAGFKGVDFRFGRGVEAVPVSVVPVVDEVGVAGVAEVPEVRVCQWALQQKVSVEAI